MLQTIGNDALGDEYRNILKAFYGVLKSTDQYLRFVFLTGVTKFGQVSVFGDLDQLNDISMDDCYAGICGITNEEMEQNFHPDMEQFAVKGRTTYETIREKMHCMYGGYRFSQNMEEVYSPFSVLDTLGSQTFCCHWSTTSISTYLTKVLQRSNFDTDRLEDAEVTELQLIDYCTKVENPVSVIYQSGYLTLKKYDECFDTYTLGFPNEEVKCACTK